MPPLSSWTATLPNNVLLDSGVLYIGSAIWSGHEGGLEFDAGTERRNINFDGKRSNVALLDRNISFAPVIKSTKMLEVTDALVKQYESGATLVTLTGGPAGATQVEPKKGGTMYVTGDYLSNVRAIWQRTDGTYVQVRFPKAIVNKWGPLVGKDKEEAGVALEIEARLDMSVSGQLVSNPPYVIEFFTAAP